MTGQPPSRHPDLDALRVGAVYLLIPFHTLKVYDPRPLYHVWSPDLIPGVGHVTAFISLWHMPLLFLLAGWSAVLSLRRRGAAVFLRERNGFRRPALRSRRPLLSSARYTGGGTSRLRRAPMRCSRYMV